MPRCVVVFGDVIDDILAIPRGPIRGDTDTPASIRFRAGGSAANAAAWLGSLGASVDFVGVVGRDDVARHTALLAAVGVRAHLRSHPDLPTGTIIVLVDGERRSMLTERGANADLDPDRVTDGLLDSAAVLHLTGYSLFHGSHQESFRGLIGRARARRVTVSIDPASAGFIRDYGVARFLDAIAGAGMLFPNRDEGRALTGLVEPERIACTLSERFGLVALTLGADGVLVASGGTLIAHVPAVATRTVDPTGAGDAFYAGFIHTWLDTGDPVAAANAGVQVAARALSVVGGRPDPPAR